MKDRLNILQLYDTMKVGGAETHIITLSTKLRELGHNLWIVASDGPGSYWIKMHKLEYIECPLNDYTKQTICVDAIVKVIKKNKIDIIHAHPYNSQIIGAFAGYITNVPVITTIHGPHETPAEQPFISDLIDHFICVSEEVKMKQIIKRVMQEKITIIPNCVPLVGNPANNIFFRNKRVIMSCIGRLDIDKIQAILFLIMAIPSLHKQLNIKLNIIGDGTYFNELQAYCEFINSSLGAEIITIVGNSLNVQHFIDDSDIIIGVGRVVLEALAAGKFAICIGNKYYPGLIDAEKLVYISHVNFTDRNIYTPFSVKQFTSDIINLYNNLSYEIKKLQETYDIVENQFSIDRSARDHLELYYNVIKDYGYKHFEWSNYEGNYPISDEFKKLLSYNTASEKPYEYTGAKTYKLLICPDINQSEDCWQSVLEQLILTIKRNDPVTIVIRIKNEYQIFLNSIADRINTILLNYENLELPDIMLDIEYHDAAIEASFLEGIDIFIPTSNAQALLELKCKLSKVKVIEQYDIGKALDILALS